MNTEHFKSYSIVRNGITIEIDLSRFEKQFKDAQYWLDNQIMTDMVPFMPMQTGTFINLTRAESAALAGTGTVVAGTPPMGRFLYEGLVMVDPETLSPWARPGVAKVLTDRPLNLSSAAHPMATPHWFEAAKDIHGKEWIKGVKERAGGGDNV